MKFFVDTYMVIYLDFCLNAGEDDLIRDTVKSYDRFLAHGYNSGSDMLQSHFATVIEKACLFVANSDNQQYSASYGDGQTE